MSYFKVMFRYPLASRQHFSRLTSNTLITSKRCLTFSANSRANEGVHEYDVKTLHKAVNKGQLERAKQLIDAGADVNYKLETGLTPLHAALEYGHVECVKLLIKSGADVNSKASSHEVTPLHFASLYGHYKCVKLLVNAGADVNTIDKDGNTPLMWAVEDDVDLFRQSCEICVEVLLHEGAKINIINKHNENALQYHMRCKYLDKKDYNIRICHVLLAAGETETSKPENILELLNKSPDFVKISHEVFRHFLKYGPRNKIRYLLLKLDKHGNLFHRVQRLGLPSWFKRYLLFNVRLLDRSDYVLDSDYND